MALRRKKMAAAAESAVYQAQTSELQEEKEVVKAEIAKAADRTEKGGEFDEYSMKIIKMHQRDIQAGPKKRKTANGFDSDEEDDKRPGRPHFDAYPTADGLSRPYGAFPVFQPAPPSGQLRHYRMETQRPIEL
jgi:hypothetical protein